MKIAVASNGHFISEHFGHCQQFTIYNIKNMEVENKEVLQNPGHQPGFLPIFLKEREINIIIAGGMGSSAQQLFKNNDIQVIVGSKGLCDDAIRLYLSGSLNSSESVCNEHQYEGECGGHK